MNDARPSERELEALKVIWDRGEATVREICDAINAGGEELAYTTVLSLLQVMEQKGLVAHRKAGKAYAYHSLAPRDRTIRRLATDFLDKVFDGAVGEYVVHALESRPITTDEIDELEKLIEKAKRQPRPKKKGPKK